MGEVKLTQAFLSGSEVNKGVFIEIPVPGFGETIRSLVSGTSVLCSRDTECSLRRLLRVNGIPTINLALRVLLDTS